MGSSSTSDMTYTVPTIVYESNSESSEDEEIEHVTRKYLK